LAIVENSLDINGADDLICQSQTTEGSKEPGWSICVRGETRARTPSK
jgi:hypothetical protein